VKTVEGELSLQRHSLDAKPGRHAAREELKTGETSSAATAPFHDANGSVTALCPWYHDPNPRKPLMSLRSLVARKPFPLRIEAHNPRSAIIADRTRGPGDDGVEREFDGGWSSSLTGSTSRGLPEIAALDVHSWSRPS
jgi:hypothetical protein